MKKDKYGLYYAAPNYKECRDNIDKSKEMKKRKKYVYLVIGANLIHGCFDTKQKAKKCIGGSPRFHIHRLEVG